MSADVSALSPDGGGMYKMSGVWSTTDLGSFSISGLI